MPRPKQIKDLHSLEEEIQYLKRKALRIERSMDESMQHLKENAGSMAWNTLLAGKFSANHPITSVLLSAFLQNEKVQSFIHKVVGNVLGSVEKMMGKKSSSETAADN